MESRKEKRNREDKRLRMKCEIQGQSVRGREERGLLRQKWERGGG